MSSPCQTINLKAPDRTSDPVECEVVFDTFGKSKLTFLHQDETRDGKLGRFNRCAGRR